MSMTMTKTGAAAGALAALLLAARRSAHAEETVAPDSAGASVSLAPKKDLTRDDYRHFLRRAHYGVAPTELAKVEKIGLEAYVDAMLDFKRDEKLEGDSAAQMGDPDFPKPRDIISYWLYLIQNTKSPFQETLAFFWHDHFAAAQDTLNAESRWWMRDHVDLWRHHGAGNLRSLLIRMCKDWTMLDWLDGIQSTNSKPNENFAREFFELFTLGRDNGYTEDDIKQTARAFTGYRRRGRREEKHMVEYVPRRHDDTSKTVFGKTANFGYDEMVDLVLEERGCAEYICDRIVNYFCMTPPPKALVDGLAAVLRKHNFELKPVLKTLFLSQAFYSDAGKVGMAKMPVEFAFGFIRETGLIAPTNQLAGLVTSMGQVPTLPPTVAGWDEGTLWFSAQAMVERANFLAGVTSMRQEQRRLGVEIATLVPASLREGERVVGEEAATATVDHLVDLLSLKLTADERSACIDFLGKSVNRRGDISRSRFDPRDQFHLEERLRGLLHILGQHPTYQVR